MSGARQRGVFSPTTPVKNNEPVKPIVNSEARVVNNVLVTPEIPDSERSSEQEVSNDSVGPKLGFKDWASLMWKNLYLQLFVVFFSVLIYEAIRSRDIINSLSDTYDHDGAIAMVFVMFGCFIPPAAVIIILYKGFYQAWQDFKTGKTR